MSTALHTRVLVVGGGPGGYVAAIRAGQLGLDTVLVEGSRLGGTCLIRGCIPSKALIHAASEFHHMAQAAVGGGTFGITLPQPPSLDFGATVAWKEGVVGQLNGGVATLLKRAKVRVVQGWASFTDGKTCRVSGPEGDVSITAEHVILANGSDPVALPALPFGGPVISSTEALSLPELPRRLIVVGAGYIGLELGIAFRKFGVDVSIVEMQDRILPLYDRKLTDPVRAWLKRHDVAVHLGARAQAMDDAGTCLRVQTGDGVELDLPFDKILITIGRRPRTAGWGLENMAVAMNGAFIQVDDRCATSMKYVWAIGDLVGEPMLAHKASAQGEMVAEIIAGQRRFFRPVTIAAVCFTEPEIVTAGLSPDEAGDQDTIVSTFPFQANGRALSMDAGHAGGFVRIVARQSDHRVLGIQAVGAHVSELAGEFAHALEMGALLEMWRARYTFIPRSGRRSTRRL